MQQCTADSESSESSDNDNRPICSVNVDKDNEHETTVDSQVTVDSVAENAAEESSEEEDDSNILLIQLADIHDVLLYRRMMCLACSIQLVIKKAYVDYEALLTKVRRIVSRLRK